MTAENGYPEQAELAQMRYYVRDTDGERLAVSVGYANQAQRFALACAVGDCQWTKHSMTTLDQAVEAATEHLSVHGAEAETLSETVRTGRGGFAVLWPSA